MRKQQILKMPYLLSSRVTLQIQNLLAEETLEALDKVSSQVFLSGELKKFPYRTISETLTLVSLTLLRDMLWPHSPKVSPQRHSRQSHVPSSFVEEVEAWATELFRRAQDSTTHKNGLEERDRRLFTLTSSNQHHSPRLLNSREAMVNRVKMLVIANSVCLELMGWCARDENGGSNV